MAVEKSGGVRGREKAKGEGVGVVPGSFIGRRGSAEEGKKSAGSPGQRVRI